MKLLLTVAGILVFSLTAFAQTPEAPKMDNHASVAPIAIPEPESAQLAASVAAFVQKKQALEAQYQTEWNQILARAALRAKLTPEQFDSLMPQGDGKGGFQWVKKADPPKVEPPKEKQ